jgi:hypothetical protein
MLLFVQKSATCAIQSLQSYCNRSLVTRGEGEQGDVTGLLDRTGEAALVGSTNTGKPPGNDLAAFCDKALQQANVAVRDRINFFGAELANLLATEELSAASRATGRTCACRTAAAATVGAWT